MVAKDPNVGPHCHYVLPAGGNGPFDAIISGAVHQGHTETGLPTGVFQATACPTQVSGPDRMLATVGR